MKKGFSLVELLVVVSIFIAISGVVLFSQNKFSSDTNVTNLAYETALVFRNAQSYGISVRASNIALNTESAYGVHFDKASRTSFFLFYDDNNNGVYNAGEKKINTYNIQYGNYISKICFNGSTVDTDCLSGNQYVDVTFLRPDPNAIIKRSGASTTYRSVEIHLTSAIKDRTKIVQVTNAGQMSVK